MSEPKGADTDKQSGSAQSNFRIIPPTPSLIVTRNSAHRFSTQACINPCMDSCCSVNIVVQQNHIERIIRTDGTSAQLRSKANVNAGKSKTDQANARYLRRCLPDGDRARFDLCLPGKTFFKNKNSPKVMVLDNASEADEVHSKMQTIYGRR
jgi:hypothetical protein